MFKTHYGETVTVVLAIVMGFLMSLAALIVDHLECNYSNIFKVWAMITLVILVVSIFVPYKEWSGKFTALFPVWEGTFPHRLLDNLLPTVILNTCNTVFVSAGNILFNPAIPQELQMTEWVHGMLRDWPITFVISYFVAFVAEYCGKRVADKYTAGPETSALEE